MRLHIMILMSTFDLVAISPVWTHVLQVDTSSTFPSTAEFAFIKSPQQAESVYVSTLHQVIGTLAPNLSFQHLADQSRDSLSNFRGSVVLVKFWSRSCPPCVKEMPDISQLQDDYYDAGLRILLLAPDDFETLNRFFSIHKTSGVKARLNYHTMPARFRLLSSFEPTFLLMDRDGLIRDTWFGAIGYDALQKRINALIPYSEKRVSFLSYLIVTSIILALTLVYIVRRRHVIKKSKPQSDQFGMPGQPSH